MSDLRDRDVTVFIEAVQMPAESALRFCDFHDSATTEANGFSTKDWDESLHVQYSVQGEKSDQKDSCHLK